MIKLFYKTAIQTYHHRIQNVSNPHWLYILSGVIASTDVTTIRFKNVDHHLDHHSLFVFTTRHASWRHLSPTVFSRWRHWHRPSHWLWEMTVSIIIFQRYENTIQISAMEFSQILIPKTQSSKSPNHHHDNLKRLLHPPTQYHHQSLKEKNLREDKKKIEKKPKKKKVAVLEKNGFFRLHN